MHTFLLNFIQENLIPNFIVIILNKKKDVYQISHLKMGVLSYEMKNWYCLFSRKSTLPKLFTWWGHLESIILSLFYRHFIRTQRVNSFISQKQFMFVVCKKVYNQTRLYWSHIGTSRSDSRYPKLRIRNNKCNEFDTEYCREPHECSLYPWFRIQYLCS